MSTDTEPNIETMLTPDQAQALLAQCGVDPLNPHSILDGLPPDCAAQVHPTAGPLLTGHAVYNSLSCTLENHLRKEAEVVEKPAPLAFKDAATADVEAQTPAHTHNINLPGLG